MKRVFFLALSYLLFFPQCYGEQTSKIIVGYAVMGDQMSLEDSSAVRWLQNHESFTLLVVNISKGVKQLNDVDVLWVHLPDSAALRILLNNEKVPEALKAIYKKGGKILFTDYGALMPYELGIETKKPEIRIDTIPNDWLWDKKGFQGFLGHPLFSGLHGGEYVWDANEDQITPFIGYYGKNFPEKGKVIAVDKAYVFVYADRKLVVEHSAGKGKILSIGSVIYFGRSNNLRANLERLIENALLYLAGERFSDKPTYWGNYRNVPLEFGVSTQPIQRSVHRQMTEVPKTGMALSRTMPHNEFFDVAGRRVLMMGKENGGLDEIWVHPLRILRDYQAGIVSGDSIAWLQHFPVSIEVRPESFVRNYSTPSGSLQEIVFASLNKAGGIIHYRSTFPARIVIRFRGDLRWMWPFDANALGDVHYAYDPRMRALHLKDTTGLFYCLYGGDAAPMTQLTGQYESIQWSGAGFSGTPTNQNQVYHAVIYELSKDNDYALNYAVLGTNEGAKKALQEYRSLLQNPEKVYGEMVDHYNQLLAKTVEVTSPDVSFDTLFKWAIVATDRFVAYTPGVGTGLLAGFSTTARGWDGGHKNSGRPGYAWYFGRDSEWSGFAIDDYGDFDVVKQQLKFLQHYQDRSGKIFHEISTSGAVHYDASDATPLYLVLAGHYLRASGDRAFVKESWPYLKKAMDFLYSTDTDGDGLIEDTNVGHGWLEGGALFGSHSEVYLCAVWAQALKDMSMISKLLGKGELATKYQSDADRVRKILNAEFWNDSTKFFNLGKMKDGTFRTEQTVLPAVSAYFNLLDDDKMPAMLEAYAGNGFSADWGIRIVSSSSPLFKPTGYHYGSIWPLFTGWAALAEYEYGNSNQGFMHITNNLYIKNHWALGYVEEVMNGAVYKPSGVCPHQCWSETNVLHPAIRGMIGWKPNALENSADLKPRLPLQWDSVTVRNLCVGRSVLQYSMKRGINRTTHSLTLLQGPEVAVDLAPEIPAGMEIKKILLDGRPVEVNQKTVRGSLAVPISIVVNKKSEVIFEHSKGIGMVPITPKPAPGDSSMGWRIITASLEGNKYTVVVQGKSGTDAAFALKFFDQTIDRVDNAEIEAGPKGGSATLRVTFDKSSDRYVQKKMVVYLH